MATYWQVEINVNDELREIIADILFENYACCEGVVLDEETYKELKLTGKSSVMKAFFSEFFTPDEIKKTILANIFTDVDFSVSVTQVEEKDWSEEWKKNWQPTKISEKIVICPSWLEYTAKDDEIVVTLDPGSAFGTGAHATTQLCVQAMEKYMKSQASLADVGCGSGILAICGLKLGAKEAVAIDNDELVIPVAIENAEINSESENVKFFTGVSTDLLGNTYDFICANILHNVLADIMHELKQLMKDDAKMVLSGILIEKEQVVLDAINREGLKLVERLVSEPWVALVVEK